MILYGMELFGTFVFAVAGALEAGKKRLDIFGVLVLACVTALGGGTLRDLILGNQPVAWIRDTNLVWCALSAGLFTFIAARFYRIPFRALLISDAMGLSLFAITGAQIAMSHGVAPVIAILMGVMSGAVGGIIRDVIANDIPMIFRKEIYATAAIMGCLVFVNLETFLPQYHEINALLGMCTVFIIRMAAIKYHLAMPVFMFADAAREEQDKE